EVGERLVVPLEVGRNLGGIAVVGGLDGPIPAARVPFPENTSLVKQVADVLLERPIRIVGIAVIDGRQQIAIGGILEGGHQVLREDGVDGVILAEELIAELADRRDLAVVYDLAAGAPYQLTCDRV